MLKINNTLQYSGIVTVELQNKKTKRKNSATKHMFELLLRVLGNQQFDSLSKPLYITILNNRYIDDKNSDKLLNVSEVVSNPQYELYKDVEMLNKLLVTNSVLQLDASTYTLTFQTTLDKSALKTWELFYSKEPGIICLIDGYKRCILAATKFDSKLLEDVQSNNSFQAIINWTIQLSSV